MKNLVIGPARRAANEATSLAYAVRSGLISPQTPQQMLRMGQAFLLHGGMAALPAVAAVRYPDRLAVIDERGSITFGQLDEQANAFANGLRSRGVRPGDGVAMLARNHRGFLVALFAAAMCGARIVLMNTDFAGPQLREVAQREGIDLLIHDDEYSAILEGIEPRLGVLRAWVESPSPDSVEALVASSSKSAPPRVTHHAKVVLLTSGTTGTPKGATRKEPRSLEPLGALLERVPFRTRSTVELPAPMFHTLGFAMAMMAVGFGSTLVVRRKFDPQAVVESLALHGASTMVAVPVMLQRLVDLDPAVFEGKDLSPADASSSWPVRSWAPTCACASPSGSVPSYTTSMAPPRLPTPPSPHPQTLLPSQAASASRSAARPCGCTTSPESLCHKGKPAASSSATRSSSTATPAVAARRSSTA